jgi:hypothetical protein
LQEFAREIVRMRASILQRYWKKTWITRTTTVS